MFLAIQTVWATTWAPPPVTVSERIHFSDVVVEAVVEGTRSDQVEGFPVTYATLRPLTVVRGEPAEEISLVVPGSSVSGAYRKLGVGFGADLSPGSVVLLFLTQIPGVAQTYSVSYSFDESVFRQSDATNGTKVTDESGRYVMDLPCNERPWRVVIPRPQPDSPDVDEDDVPAAMLTQLPGLLFADEPESLAIHWDEAIAELLGCVEEY